MLGLKRLYATLRVASVMNCMRNFYSAQSACGTGYGLPIKGDRALFMGGGILISEELYNSIVRVAYYFSRVSLFSWHSGGMIRLIWSAGSRLRLTSTSEVPAPSGR